MLSRKTLSSKQKTSIPTATVSSPLPPPRLRDSLPEENLWWYNSFGEIRIPYAITTDAITYYSDSLLPRATARLPQAHGTLGDEREA